MRIEFSALPHSVHVQRHSWNQSWALTYQALPFTTQIIEFWKAPEKKSVCIVHLILHAAFQVTQKSCAKQMFISIPEMPHTYHIKTAITLSWLNKCRCYARAWLCMLVGGLRGLSVWGVKILQNHFEPARSGKRFTDTIHKIAQLRLSNCVICMYRMFPTANIQCTLRSKLCIAALPYSLYAQCVASERESKCVCVRERGRMIIMGA